MSTPKDATDLSHPPQRPQRVMILAAIVLVLVHAAMLAHAASCHGPTKLEPAFLVAGLSHWKFGRFEIFRVNPPLVRMIAALPVLQGECEFDWTEYDSSPGARSEFALGAGFVRANGHRFQKMLTHARWACIPFSLIGGLICGLWARELWKSDVAGLTALAVWSWDPNILAHGELITTDCAAASFGVGAGFLFWRWLNRPTWTRAFCAGAVLGLALLSKTSWLLLLALWPTLWVTWSLIGSSRGRTPTDTVESSPVRRSITMLCGIMATALYTVNLGYAFDGTGSTLGEYEFFSRKLSGNGDLHTPGNRFRNSPLSMLVIPLPRQFVCGIDLQMRDFENYPQRSYLRGEWKDGGWWYYYLYCVMVKVPHGTQLLLLVAIFFSSRMLIAANRTWLDIFVLLLPAVTLFVVVSSQCEFNHHYRYVLPGYGFVTVLMAGLTTLKHPSVRTVTVACITATALSVLFNYPHQLAYFNAGSGGSHRGADHLLGSNFDWGQDIPLEWDTYRKEQVQSPGCHVVLVTEDQPEIAALFPNDRSLSESAIGLGDYDAKTLVISQSALKCEASQRRQRYVDFVSIWLERRRGGFTATYPSPTILVLHNSDSSGHFP